MSRPTFIKLEKLEGAARTPTLLLGEPVVGVALVLGRFAHVVGELFVYWHKLWP